MREHVQRAGTLGKASDAKAGDEEAHPTEDFAGAPAPMGTLSEEEAASGAYSEIVLHPARAVGGLQFALIASGAHNLHSVRPTVIAISGEEQLHVSKFFRAWRAEARQWQVVVPLRPGRGTPYLFEPQGAQLVLQLMRAILASEDKLLVPHGVEGGRFHLIGTSNGGASVLAAAVRAPELVASLTLVTGFIPAGTDDLGRLAGIPAIRLYVGDADNLGHDVALQDLKQRFDALAVPAELHVLEGARHSNVGQYIDMEAFWQGLEVARIPQVAFSVDSCRQTQ